MVEKAFEQTSSHPSTVGSLSLSPHTAWTVDCSNMTEISNHVRHVAVATIIVLAIAGEGPELLNESTSNEATFFFYQTGVDFNLWKW